MPGLSGARCLLVNSRDIPHTGVDQMNQRVLPDINVGGVRLFDDPAILQPGQALEIVLAHVGWNGDDWVWAT